MTPQGFDVVEKAITRIAEDRPKAAIVEATAISGHGPTESIGRRR
jgi:hypothetical protein